MEDLPTISPDGKRLYFSYSPIDTPYLIITMTECVKSGKDPQECYESAIKFVGPMRYPFTEKKIHNGQVHYNYMATKTGKSWSEPEFMDFQEGDSYYYGIEDVSDDGQTALLFGSRGPNNIGTVGDIYISHKVGGEWSLPQNLGAPVNTVYLEDNADFSTDGRVIYFDSNKPGHGKFDIWKTEKNPDGTWSEPVNLGPPINDALEQKFPWINKTGNRLYFSSETSEGMRIHVSEKTGNRWGTPKLIDIDIDTAASMFALGSSSLTEDEKTLYFYLLEYYMLTPTGNSNFDIYYSQKQPDGTWTKARPVD